MRYITIATLATILALLVPRAAVAQDGPPSQCFAETGQCLEGRFRSYWQQNGSLPVFGFPVTASAQWYSEDSGRVVLTQWLERVRFEQHGDQPPYDVQLGRLGDERLQQLKVNWRQFPAEASARPGCLWFAETKRNVCDQGGGEGFASYWLAHGLQMDSLTPYARSLALFGLPLTPPRMETNAAGDRVLTQWFERARFEWHPGNPAGQRVLLGLLGNEVKSAEKPQVSVMGKVATIGESETLPFQEMRLQNAPGQPSVTILITPATRITRQSNGMPLPIGAIRLPGTNPDGDSVMAFGLYRDENVLTANAIVVMTQ